ncbi:hypothetical protein BC830DRAFT_1152403 [Chytriomyces sp. MP71]|nr:hypothetical protein BC830DRAFT_1152403 [Chytriomyces sp. MP71]
MTVNMRVPKEISSRKLISCRSSNLLAPLLRPRTHRQELQYRSTRRLQARPSMHSSWLRARRRNTAPSQRTRLRCMAPLSMRPRRVNTRDSTHSHRDSRSHNLPMFSSHLSRTTAMVPQTDFWEVLPLARSASSAACVADPVQTKWISLICAA